MRPAPRLILPIGLIAVLAPAAFGQSSPGDALKGWSAFWSRTQGAGSAVADPGVRRDERPSIRVEHKGERDWSLGREKSEAVVPGSIYNLSAWIKTDGKSKAVLSAVIRDAKGETIDWSYGAVTATSNDWKRIETRFMIPPGAKTMQPRITGDGPATVWIAEFSADRDAQSIAIAPTPTGRKLTLANDKIRLEVDPAAATFRLRDARSGREWSQHAPKSPLLVVGSESTPDSIRLDLVDPRTILRLNATFTLDPARPELLIKLTGDGPLAGSLAYPYAFATAAGETLIMPVNEGMSYPVDDPSLPPMHYILYGGHGLCMGWWGVVDGPKGLMAIVETPDDASIHVPRVDGRLQLAPNWDPHKGTFGPARKIRYIPVAEGGYVAMAKRYREHAKAIGLFKTLAEKRAANPNIDKLVGAVNVWCWDGKPAPIVRELKAAGIDRILWSNASSPEQLAEMNAMGVLTSRYDIYQDVMDPAVFPRLRSIHGDWPTKAWPADLMIDSHGDWIKGWEVETKDGARVPCGITCDRQAPAYAVQRIGEELKTHPYQSRFIDTTTASPWRECYSPNHPVDRSESRKFKMDLLDVVHGRYKLVTGCETGHDASVPFVDYFEGMMSLGPYRIRDAGRRMQEVVEEVPPQIEKFQVGSFYRLPLWELVYHDCVVAQWYWGDYNNKLPAVWDRRDLLNALYGTPPMFMFTADSWRKNRDRFIKSYQTAARVARDTGYSEMLSHEWLTPDHEVQRTTFANGEVVVVNFGSKPYQAPNGETIAPLGLNIRPGTVTP